MVFQCIHNEKCPSQAKIGNPVFVQAEWLVRPGMVRINQKRPRVAAGWPRKTRGDWGRPMDFPG